MRKTIVMLMVTAMLVSALAGCAQQAESPPEVVTEQPTETPMPKPEATPDPTPAPEPEQPFRYKDNGDGTCTITNYIGERRSDIDIEIPEEIDGLTVTALRMSLFYHSYFIKSLVLPDSITDIEATAFNYCSSIEGNLILPNSLVSIGTRAFEHCNKLTGSLIIPNNIMTIEEAAFIDCSGFTGSLTIGDSITAIGNYAFARCGGLTQAEFLGDAPTEFGEDVFGDCSDDFKIIYDPAKEGWSTPEWNGYPCYPKSE